MIDQPPFDGVLVMKACSEEVDGDELAGIFNAVPNTSFS